MRLQIQKLATLHWLKRIYVRLEHTIVKMCSFGDFKSKTGGHFVKSNQVAVVYEGLLIKEYLTTMTSPLFSTCRP